MLAVGLLMIGVISGVFLSRDRGVGHSFPLILKEVREMGELHLVAHEYEHVMEHETHREAAGWAKSVPGVSDLVAASTRNRGLVTVRGTVEAGIDLSQAYGSTRGDLVVLHVPEPVLYAPNVTTRVHSQKRGLFWRDVNFATDAESTAGKNFLTASQERGILEAARKQAVRTLESLVLETGGGRVVVEFYRPASAS